LRLEQVAQIAAVRVRLVDARPGELVGAAGRSQKLPAAGVMDEEQAQRSARSGVGERGKIDRLHARARAGARRGTASDANESGTDHEREQGNDKQGFPHAVTSSGPMCSVCATARLASMSR